MELLDWRRALMAIAIVLGVGASAMAQSGLADIRGTVVDESSAALPGVTVTATHVETGTSRTTVTSTTGVFLMPALQVGKYKLQLELTGFNSVVQDNLLLEVGQASQALAEFEASQRTDPNRLHGLAGAAQAAERAGDRARARR